MPSRAERRARAAWRICDRYGQRSRIFCVPIHRGRRKSWPVGVASVFLVGVGTHTLNTGFRVRVGEKGFLSQPQGRNYNELEWSKL